MKWNHFKSSEAITVLAIEEVDYIVDQVKRTDAANKSIKECYFGLCLMHQIWKNIAANPYDSFVGNDLTYWLIIFISDTENLTTAVEKN